MADIKKFLGMNEESYVVNILQSMIASNPKKRLITSDPILSEEQTKSLARVLAENPDIKFYVNTDFKSKSKKVLFKDAKFAEKKEDDGVVEEERRHSVQSVIVRVMKSRKEMNYNDLVNEVEKLMFKFRPTTRVSIYQEIIF